MRQPAGSDGEHGRYEHRHHDGGRNGGRDAQHVRPSLHRAGRRVIRLLIVDDHAAVRHGLQQMFATVSGIEVVGVAVDGCEAVSQTNQFGPDVVLMDIEMPNIDGVEATRRITTTHPTSRVVILSASHDQTRIQAALQAGAVSYVAKHSDPNQVVRAVQDAGLAESRPTLATCPDREDRRHGLDYSTSGCP